MSATTESPADNPEQLRAALTERLLARGRIRTPAVEGAFRRVPRHVFAPEAELTDAYADTVVGVRRAADGQATSSVSAPWLQADMLEAARLRPGQQVLEIGSGGYNAALAAELVGDKGRVTTVDIDPDITARAARFLNATGHHNVRVITADAAHLPSEIVPAGGFDAVIVTVETCDLPWLDLVAEGGRLVAPLRLHGYTWSFAFTKQDGLLVCNEPGTVCGFVPMQGSGARERVRHTVPGSGVSLAFEDGPTLPITQLAGAFDSAPCDIGTGVTVGDEEPFTELLLYLAGALTGFCRLSVAPDEQRVLNPPLAHWPAAAIVRGAGLARLTHRRTGEDEAGAGVHEFVVHGYGTGGRRAAEEMAGQVRYWQRNHRAARCPRITARPRTLDLPTDDAGHHIVKDHVHLTLEWPVVPVSRPEPEVPALQETKAPDAARRRPRT